MKMTDNEGFDIFYLRDDNIKNEEKCAQQNDLKKGEFRPENKEEIAKSKKTAEIIKFILLVLILITTTITMIFAIRIYYTQSETQHIVFPQSVIGNTDASYGDIVIDTADDIDIGEFFTTQVYVELPPDVIQQSDNIVSNNKKPAVSVATTKASETTTVKTEVVQTTAVATTEKSDGLLNINFATKEQLMTLEGIGEKKADAIIEYRIENGAFLSVDELLEVDGIGEGLLEKNRTRITVDY